MKREIKFRGMTKANNVMVFGDLIACPNGEHRIIWFELKGELPLDVDCTSYNEVIQSSTIGQFTGIKDEVEKEIWEGDILEFPFETGIAYVINDGFRFAVKSPGSESVDYEGETVLKQARVIGNIYQNPELLSTPTAVL